MQIESIDIQVLIPIFLYLPLEFAIGQNYLDFMQFFGTFTKSYVGTSPSPRG